MLSIGKQLTAEQRLWKATTDIIGKPEFVALAGVLMVGSKKIVDGLPTACTNGRDEAYGGGSNMESPWWMLSTRGVLV